MADRSGNRPIFLKPYKSGKKTQLFFFLKSRTDMLVLSSTAGPACVCPLRLRWAARGLGQRWVWWRLQCPSGPVPWRETCRPAAYTSPPWPPWRCGSWAAPRWGRRGSPGPPHWVPRRWGGPAVPSGTCGRPSCGSPCPASAAGCWPRPSPWTPRWTPWSTWSAARVTEHIYSVTLQGTHVIEHIYSVTLLGTHVIQHIYSVTLLGTHVIQHIHGDYRAHLRCDAAGYTRHRAHLQRDASGYTHVIEHIYGDYRAHLQCDAAGYTHVIEHIYSDYRTHLQRDATGYTRFRAHLQLDAAGYTRYWAHLQCDAAGYTRYWAHLQCDAAGYTRYWAHLQCDAAGYTRYWAHLQCDAAGYTLNRMIWKQCYGEHHGTAENTVKHTVQVTEDTVWHCRDLHHLLTHYGWR